jgi:hypothetical protein
MAAASAGGLHDLGSKPNPVVSRCWRVKGQGTWPATASCSNTKWAVSVVDAEAISSHGRHREMNTLILGRAILERPGHPR